MAKCRYCGAYIKWVETPAEKYVPVEPRPVRIRTDRGTEEFVTDQGKAVKGARVLPAAAGGGNLVAFVPHRTFCRGPGRRGQ